MVKNTVLLRELPKDIRKNFLAELRKNNHQHYISKDSFSLDIELFLAGGFTWRKSKQGYKYWSDLADFYSENPPHLLAKAKQLKNVNKGRLATNISL